MTMELTEQQMRDVANDIAADNPRILLSALRNNGFWIYAVNKDDVQEHIEQHSEVSPTSDKALLPINNEDIAYVNESFDILDQVDYNGIIQSIISDIRHKRHQDEQNNEETK